jgi:YHS domain-containing protein
MTGLRALAASMAVVLAGTVASAEEGAPLNQTADGVAMDGFDVVAYFADGAPAKGDPAHSVSHAGATWLFSTPEHAAAFAADPAAYAPQSNGWCSYAVSEGYAAEVDFVKGWTVIDGKLYLNWDAATLASFVAEKDKRVPAAAANWPAVSAGLVNGSVPFYRHSDDPSVGISHPQALN